MLMEFGAKYERQRPQSGWSEYRAGSAVMTSIRFHRHEPLPSAHSFKITLHEPVILNESDLK